MGLITDALTKTLNSPMTGMAIGLLGGGAPGGTFASGAQQGLLNMQAMNASQARQQQVEAMRQLAQQSAERQQAQDAARQQLAQSMDPMAALAYMAGSERPVNQMFPDPPAPAGPMVVGENSHVLNPDGTWTTPPRPQGGGAAPAAWMPSDMRKEFNYSDYTPESVSRAEAAGDPRLLERVAAPVSYGDQSALRKDVKALETEYRTSSRAAKQLDALLSKGGGIADLGAQINYIKSLDPTSVVREGEVAMQQQAGGLINHIDTLWNQATRKGGAGLTAQTRQQLQDATRELVNIMKSEYEAQVQPYYDKYPDVLLSQPVTFPEMTTPVYGGTVPADQLDAAAAKYPPRRGASAKY